MEQTKTFSGANHFQQDADTPLLQIRNGRPTGFYGPVQAPMTSTKTRRTGRRILNLKPCGANLIGACFPSVQMDSQKTPVTSRHNPQISGLARKGIGNLIVADDGDSPCSIKKGPVMSATVIGRMLPMDGIKPSTRHPAALPTLPSIIVPDPIIGPDKRLQTLAEIGNSTIILHGQRHRTREHQKSKNGSSERRIRVRMHERPKWD
jgi:hypothetical protein